LLLPQLAVYLDIMHSRGKIRYLVLAVSVWAAVAFPSPAVAGPDEARLQEIRAGYQAGVAAAEAAYRTAVEALLNDCLETTEEMMRRARESRDLPQLATARKSAAVFEECKRQLAESGNCEIPERVPAEVKYLADQFSIDKRVLEAEKTVKLAEVDRKYFAEYVDAVKGREGQDSGPAELRKAFQDMLAGEVSAAAVPVDEQATAEQKAPEQVLAVPVEAAGDTPVPDEVAVIATQGQSREWVTFATWSATVSSLTVYSIPVAGRRQAESGKEFDPVFGQEYQVRYIPVRVISPRAETPFRVRSVPGKQAAEVVTFPRESNGWRLTVRMRPSGAVPAEFAIELQTGAGAVTEVLAGAEKTSAPAAEEAHREATAAAALVRVGIRTAPAGAAVYVDGELYREGSVAPRTPCIVNIPAGSHDIRLRLPGYDDGVFAGFEAADKKVINWRFERAGQAETVTVSPRVGWRSSSIAVGIDDEVTINARGAWSTGDKQENVGPDGYPRASRFAHYYDRPEGAPVQLADAQYGALLVRIGSDGPILNAGVRLAFVADRPGELYFDTNEITDDWRRRDNTGELEVQVQVTPRAR
jgi:hypothetical protein